MIKGVHTLFYSAEPDALRAFLRDKLELNAHDIGGGWLIFDLPEADMGVHPAAGPEGSPEAAAEPPAGTHHISFYCDAVAESRTALEARGVTFVDEIQDMGFGLVTNFEIPGGQTLQLYQPRYSKG